MNRSLRESRKLLEPLGYEYQGLNENSHLVYRHGETGAIARVVNGFDATTRGKANMVAQAKRAIREYESLSQRWIQFIRDHYGIGDHDQKLVSISIPDLAAEFEAQTGLQMSRKLPGVALTNSPYVDHVKAGHGGKQPVPGVYRVRGVLFGVNHGYEKEEGLDVLGADDQSVREPAPDPVAGGDAVPAGSGEAQPVAGGEADAEAGEHDPEPDESDRPTRKLTEVPVPGTAGVFLPDEAVAAIRAAIGADGDLEAENALLRESLADASRVVGEAAQQLLTVGLALDEALSLHDPKPKPHKQRLGVKRTQQLNLLWQFNEINGMPERFTAETIEPILGVSHTEALNLLYALKVNGYMHSTARGVYEWSAQ